MRETFKVGGHSRATLSQLPKVGVMKRAASWLQES